MLLLAILFAGVTLVTAQNNDLQKWVNKDNVYSDKQNKSRKGPNVVRDAGFYLEKSANYQYGAIGLSGASACLSIVGAFMTDKVETNEKGEAHIKKNNGRTACYVGAGICAFAAICCEITSINYKLKAGRSLQLFTTGTGGGLAYTF